jgi:demethylmenaquinone methyltransferase/2-methoxy-6-polyprenyl-1,4-benzoquinol methylase
VNPVPASSGSGDEPDAGDRVEAAAERPPDAGASVDGALPTGEAKAAAVRGMFDRIAGRYDLLNRTLTFGMDVAWRRRAVRSLGLPASSLVLDLACGTGDFCRGSARAGYRPFGFDFAFGMLANARTDAPLVQADALRLPVANGCADGITCGFALRNVVDLRALFAEMARVLRPGGRIAILEVSEPSSRIVRAGHAAYFNHVVPFVGGLVSDRAAYRYLPRSVGYLPDPDDLLELIGAAGFARPRRLALAGGIAQLLTGTRA